MNNEVYVFVDEDAHEVLVFSELERAQKEGWPEEEDWEQDSDDEWVRGDCCKIYRKEIDEL